MPNKVTQFASKKTGGKYPFPVEDILLPVKDCYMNNTLIKKRDVDLSKLLQPYHWAEIKKCKENPKYFFENYLRIVSIDGGLVPFKLYDYQIEMLDLFVDNNFSIALTARQMGKTQTVGAYLLWYAMFNAEQKDIGILANKGDQSKEVLRRIKEMFEHLPFFLQIGVTTWNKTSIAFETGTVIFSAATSSSSIRGKSIAVLYIDEAAFIANDFEFFESTYPVITSGESSRVIMTSTPKGKRGVFYQKYIDSEAGKNEFKHIKVAWNLHPKRDEEWKRKTIANTSVSQFNQEFEANFVGSSGSLIPADVLELLVFQNPIIENDYLSIYYKYDPEHKYVAIVDCAEGVEQDSSVITVIDVTNIPYKVVAVYRDNKISPLLFPHHIVALCNQYGSCPVLVEANNDVGGQVSYILYYELEYENVILTTPDNKGRGAEVNVSRRAIPGVKTTSKVKAIGCVNLKAIIENGKIELNSSVIIDELGTFVANKNSYEADDGAHDDTVMTLVLFSWLIKQDFFKDYTSQNIQQSLYETNTEMLMEELSPVGVIETHVFESENVSFHGDVKITHGNDMEAWFNS